MRKHELEVKHKLKQEAKELTKQKEEARIAAKRAEGYTCRRCRNSTKFDSNTKLHKHIRTRHAKKPKPASQQSMPSPPASPPTSPKLVAKSLATPSEPSSETASESSSTATPSSTSISVLGMPRSRSQLFRPLRMPQNRSLLLLFRHLNR